jgi:glycosyltransferase involved in cell wall biosynthesis
MEPLISIVLCTYNGERFLQEQIDSLLQQTWANTEIIVSDDQSSDGTRNILRQYENDRRFHIHFQPVNLGAIRNFEFATGLATGEYIAFSDQDDIWLPEKIEKLYRAIGDHWMAYSDSILVDENGQSLQQQLSGLRRMYSGKDTKGFVFSNVVWGHAMMINRQLLPHVLPIPSNIPHDIWFAYKAAVLTGIVYIDEPLNLYRQHKHTVTTTIATKAVTRTNEKRYKDFEEKLHWITVMHEHASPNEKGFYSKLKHLYGLKAKGNTVWPLFRFLVKHQQALFRFTNKSFISRVIELRKQARGERP